MEENSFLRLITPDGNQRIIVYDNNFPNGQMINNRLNIRISNPGFLRFLLSVIDIFKDYIGIHDFNEEIHILIDRTTGEILDWNSIDDFDSTHVYEIRSNRNQRRSYRLKSSVRKLARKARISKKKSVRKVRKTSKRKSARRTSKRKSLRKSRGKYRC